MPPNQSQYDFSESGEQIASSFSRICWKKLWMPFLFSGYSIFWLREKIIGGCSHKGRRSRHYRLIKIKFRMVMAVIQAFFRIGWTNCANEFAVGEKLKTQNWSALLVGISCWNHWRSQGNYTSSVKSSTYQKVGHTIMPRDRYVYYPECPTISTQVEAGVAGQHMSSIEGTIDGICSISLSLSISKSKRGGISEGSCLRA